MQKPELWALERLVANDFGHWMVWTHESLRVRVLGRFPGSFVARDDRPRPGLDSLLVVGGGELIDRAKVWRADESPSTRLFVIPSLWASGAEVSPIAVLNGESGKVIRRGPELLPDVRAIWGELAQSVPDPLALQACGDVWAHALEGFLSPLGSEETRGEAAEVLRDLLALPPGRDPRWFELGARACAVQARASVGLVHGIAHVLEPQLRGEGLAAGHARLCATYLWPVLRLERRRSEKVDALLERHGLVADQVEGVLQRLFEPEFYRQTLPALKESWQRILRDPCTRTNCVLVRADHLQHFLEEQGP